MSDLWKLVEQGQKNQASQFGMVNAMSQLQQMGTDARVRESLADVDMNSPDSIVAGANRAMRFDPKVGIAMREQASRLTEGEREKWKVFNRHIIAAGRNIMLAPPEQQAELLDRTIDHFVNDLKFPQAEAYRNRLGDLPIIMSTATAALDSLDKAPEIKDFFVKDPASGKLVKTPHFWSSTIGRYERVSGVEGKPDDPMSDIGKLQADFNAGRISQDQLKAALEARTKTRVVFDPKTGSPIFYEGPGKGLPSGIGTATNNKIEQQITDNALRLDRVSRIMAGYKPEWLTFAAKVKNWGSAVAEKAGVELDPEEQKNLTEFTTFKARAAADLSLTLKDMSGGAVTPEEAGRLLKSIPDPSGDSPTEFMAKMTEVQRSLVLAQARLSYMRENGLEADFRGGKVPVGLDDMPAIMAARENKIRAELAGSNMEGGQLEQEVRARLAQSFGLR